MADDDPPEDDDFDFDEMEENADLGEMDDRPEFDEMSAEDVDWEEYEEYFEDRSVDSAESDDIFETIEEESDASDFAEEEQPEDEHVVPIRSYCQTCRYFSDPPDVHCTHEGTTILEFVDMDHVKVQNCPIVAERQSLVGLEEVDLPPGQEEI